jgi:hypothetical protein
MSEVQRRQVAAAPDNEHRRGRGCLSVAELATNAGLSEAKMRRILAGFEAAGIAERVGESWRLTDAAVEKYCLAFDEIRRGNVPLEEGDDDGLSHCTPGLRPRRRGDRPTRMRVVARELRICGPNHHPRAVTVAPFLGDACGAPDI